MANVIPPGCDAAFWAAIEALARGGVIWPHVRGPMALKAVVEVDGLRTRHGAGHVRELAHGDLDGRRAVVLHVLNDRPSSWASVTHVAVDAAVKAAAEVLAED